jgi:hypothetical protein
MVQSCLLAFGRQRPAQSGRNGPVVILSLDSDIVRCQCKNGSPRESDEACILCGFLKSNEFGLGKGQSLCFEQQIVDIAIAATAAQQCFDIPVDGFYHA